MDSSSTGTRPVNFVFLSGEAQPLTFPGTDRRFWLVEEDKATPLWSFEQSAKVDDLFRRWEAWQSRRAAVASAAQAPAHPSRSAPKCVDCAHYSRGDKMLGNGPYCAHPAAPVDLVTGHMSTRAAQARSERDGAPCGPEGRLFVPREQLAD